MLLGGVGIEFSVHFIKKGMRGGWGHHLQGMSLTDVYLIIKKFSRFKHLSVSNN